MTTRTLRILALAGGVLVSGLASPPLYGQKPLAATQHPTLPRSESALWLVPAAGDRTARVSPSSQTLAAAVRRS